MTDEKTLKDLIKKQAEMIESATEHLNNLKKLAIDKGVNIEDNLKTPKIKLHIREEIERKRNEILAKVEQIKAQSKTDAQNAINKAKESIPKNDMNFIKNLPDMPLAEKDKLPDDINELIRDIPQDKRDEVKRILEDIKNKNEK